MGILSDLISGAESKLGLGVDTSNDGSDINVAFGGTASAPDLNATFGGQLYNAIYAFGSGAVDKARNTLVSGFLRTNEGKKVQAAGVQQTLSQYMPLVVVAVIGLLIVGVLIGKR